MCIKQENYFKIKLLIIIITCISLSCAVSELKFQFGLYQYLLPKTD